MESKSSSSLVLRIIIAMVLSRLASALNSPMQVRKLGSSDLMVSEVCLGTMTWGVQNTDEEGAEQMDYYYNECGGNFFDTAEMYPVPTTAETQGRTDNCIRKWMQSRGIDRSKLVLATKVAGASDRITWLPGRNGEGSRVTKKEIITSVDESLKRLGTDYIDLLQIHWPDRYVPLFGTSGYNISEEREATSFEEQLEGMQEVIQAGKVRYIGVSNETPYGVMKFCQLADQLGLPRICSIQNSYSLLVRTEIEQGLSEVCSKRNENVGLLAYSPLAGGILSNKYTGDEESTKNSRLTLFPGFMDRYKQSLAVKAVAAYADIAKQLGMTPAEFALAWCYSRPEVTSSIIGATSVAQLKENMGALEHVSKITPDVIAQADEVFKVYRDPSKV